MNRMRRRHTKKAALENGAASFAQLTGAAL
jgi:hypothetical protein